MIRPAQWFGVLMLLFNFNFNSLVCGGLKHNYLKTTRTHRYLKKSRRKSSFKKQAGAHRRSKRSQDAVKEHKKGSNDRDTNMALHWNNVDHHLDAEDTTKMTADTPTCRPWIRDAPVVETENPVLRTTTAPVPVPAAPILLSPLFESTQNEPSSSITTRPVGLEDPTLSAQPSFQSPLAIHHVPSIAPTVFETPTPSSAYQDPVVENPTTTMDPSEFPAENIPSLVPYESRTPSWTTSNQEPVLGNPTFTLQPSEALIAIVPSSAPYNHVETSTPSLRNSSPTASVGDSSIEPSYETPPVNGSPPSKIPTTITTTTPTETLTPFGDTGRPSLPSTTDVLSFTSRGDMSLMPSSLEPSRGDSSDTKTQLPTESVYPSSSSPILSDDTAVFQDDDIIGRMIQVDLNPFQLLFLYNSSSSSSSSSGANVALGTHRDSDETRGNTKILQITKEHLTKTLVMWEDAFFRSLELFPVMAERNALNDATTKHVVPSRRYHQGWTTTATTTTRMMTFAGSAFFDHDTVDAVPLQDRVDQVTMLAFLGTNLTTYTRLLEVSLNLSITDAQLYTIHGYRMAYSNGTMYVETENSNELLLDGDDAMVWIHLVAIGFLSLVGLSVFFIGGHHVLMSQPMQQLQYSRVASVSPAPLGTMPIAAQIPPLSSRS